MAVRKREWATREIRDGDGKVIKPAEERSAWVVDYTDQTGNRRLKTFKRKKDADAYAATTHIEVREGTHIADSASITVAAAGELWIAKVQQDGRERTTIEQYQQHLKFHIIPYLGNTKLSQLSAPIVRAFEDKLRAGTPEPGAEKAEPRSLAMTKKIIGSLGALLAEAQERGLVARNVVRELRSRRKPGKERRAERREKGKLKVGVDIPTPGEIKALTTSLKGFEGRWRPLLLTAIFIGLRSSELRGLRWTDIDFKKGELHVHQRADRYQEIGQPKSEAGERTVPIPPALLNALREWKLACPKGDLGLCFPNSDGTVDWHSNIIHRGLIPAMIAAGVSTIVKDAAGKVVKDDKGEPVREAKYTGLHALRHFYASWCINREVDGGLALPAKVVQERLGHSSITVTLDTYGHLFPRGDDTAALGKAESALLS
jgi:integrase